MTPIVRMLAFWLNLLTLLLTISSANAHIDARSEQQQAISDQATRDPSTIVKNLRPLLSSRASVVIPSSPEGLKLQVRASTPRVSPGYAAIVEVATEDDVTQTIKYANRHDIPFLAVGGSHGWPSTLNRAHDAIQINMRKLNSTKLNLDGKTAHIGGGALQYEVVAELFKHGKAAVTGACECVSVIGPLLGGGHGLLQSRHGFSADNLVSARVVLADGSVKNVSSRENSDLFWAMRGAGHNFGIVTSFDVQVYDAAERWGMHTFTFLQDKLEAMLETWNELEDLIADPGVLALNGAIVRNDELDNDHPVINLQIFHEGNNTAVNDYITAFRKLNPTAETDVDNIAYGDLYSVGGFHLASPVCRKNENILAAANSFPRWNPAAIRRGFKYYTEITADKTFATSAWLLESYGRSGVRDVPVDSNAVAAEERDYHILTSPIFWWKGDDEDDRQKSAWYRRKIQQAVRTEDVPFHTYVNYASGHDCPADMYGRDKARLARLKALKKQWDPQNRFGFYNPI